MRPTSALHHLLIVHLRPSPNVRALEREQDAALGTTDPATIASPAVTVLITCNPRLTLVAGSCWLISLGALVAALAVETVC